MQKAGKHQIVTFFEMIMDCAHWDFSHKTEVIIHNFQENDMQIQLLVYPFLKLPPVYWNVTFPWWCDGMETVSVLPAFCERNLPVTGGFPPQMKGSVTRALLFSSSA